MSAAYDAGVLVAADRNDREVWADHRARLEAGAVPTTTAPIIAQVSRSPRQVRLRRFLRGCDVVSFGTDDAHSVGHLLGAAGTADVVDGQLTLVAARRRLAVLTSDPADIEALSAHLSEPVVVQRV